MGYKINKSRYQIQLKRYYTVKEMKKLGFSLSEIGAYLEISRQRAKVIADREGPPYPRGSGIWLDRADCVVCGSHMAAIAKRCPSCYADEKNLKITRRDLIELREMYNEYRSR